MNNFVIGLKRFFTNKNVVTILLVLVILIVLYIGYSSSIKKQTNPINMPVAAKTIYPQTKITNEDVTYKKVANSMISEGAVRNSNAIIGMYTNVNVTIPEGSIFYKEWLAKSEEVPGNWIEQLDHETGELGYYMSVNISSTLGNSVLPNTYIDMYMKATDENGTIMFGKLMKNIKVLVVHDANGKNVFSNTAEVGAPSKIGFAVKPDMYTLLKKTEYLRDIELILAPRGSTVPTENYVIVASSTLRDYIDAQTITIDEDIIADDQNPDNQDPTNPENPVTSPENDPNVIQ